MTSEPMISAAKLEEVLGKRFRSKGMIHYDDLMAAIADIPAVDAVEVVDGDKIGDVSAVEVVEVVDGHKVGDVCFYGFAGENKSLALVEIVRILNDERGVAEVRFLKVFVDDTGNGFFDYLLRTGQTMNASFRYLKNITPKYEEENK